LQSNFGTLFADIKKQSNVKTFKNYKGGDYFETLSDAKSGTLQ
jgi:hypothetical protein